MRARAPYFMKNQEWYYFDEENFCYKLTDKAPPDAVKSYNEFYADKTYTDENGEVSFIQDS